MQRTLVLGLAAIVIFAAVVLIMLQVMPAPLEDSDYLVIGSVATLVSMLVLFVVLISTKAKARDVFFKRRKKQP